MQGFKEYIAISEQDMGGGPMGGGMGGMPGMDAGGMGGLPGMDPMSGGGMGGMPPMGGGMPGMDPMGGPGGMPGMQPPQTVIDVSEPKTIWEMWKLMYGDQENEKKNQEKTGLNSQDVLQSGQPSQEPMRNKHLQNAPGVM